MKTDRPAHCGMRSVGHCHDIALATYNVLVVVGHNNVQLVGHPFRPAFRQQQAVGEPTVPMVLKRKSINTC
jgi:hypothetical protein